MSIPSIILHVAHEDVIPQSLAENVHCTVIVH